jgi:hypothetical protein
MAEGVSFSIDSPDELQLCPFGRYVGGAASMYRGTDLLAQSNRGIVVVTIQYRLGLFGEDLPARAVFVSD